MSTKAPTTLQELTMQFLVRNQAVAVSSIDSLPVDSFLQLFKKAFAYRSTEILNAMVQGLGLALPPSGSTHEDMDLKDLEVALDLINMLWRQKVHPR
jgi:hypothetical protein